MARVTATDVKAIITTTLTDLEIDIFITPANLLVTAKLGEKDLSDAFLKEIERWLAAHFLSIFLQSSETSGRVITRKRVGETEEEYKDMTQVNKSSDLFTTNYGKQACVLDTTGTLVNLGKRKAKIEAIEVTLE